MGDLTDNLGLFVWEMRQGGFSESVGSFLNFVDKSVLGDYLIIPVCIAIAGSVYVGWCMARDDISRNYKLILS